MIIQKPKRVTRSYVQHLLAPPARVFPLLCPVREAEWLEGWDPNIVLSESGVAEDGCVFVTGAERTEAVWVVTRHEPASGLIEMLKISPGVTACRLSIILRGTPEGCDAMVTYSHTSLGPAGDDFVDAFTMGHYLTFMADWEKRLNSYLRTGRCWSGDDAAPESHPTRHP